MIPVQCIYNKQRKNLNPQRFDYGNEGKEGRRLDRMYCEDLIGKNPHEINLVTGGGFGSSRREPNKFVTFLRIRCLYRVRLNWSKGLYKGVNREYFQDGEDRRRNTYII